MSKLPERFPEYSIMYKTILSKIKSLEQEKNLGVEDEKGIQLKIEKYQKELDKIKKMFPENFFEKY